MEEKIRRIYVPMTESGFYILFCLQKPQHGYGISQQVKKMTGGEVSISAGTMYGTLSKMEKDGLIVRHYDSSDSRLKRISPSETAAAFAPSVDQSCEELEKEIIDGIDEADLEVFLRVIDKMAHNIEQ